MVGKRGGGRPAVNSACGAGSGVSGVGGGGPDDPSVHDMDVDKQGSGVGVGGRALVRNRQARTQHRVEGPCFADGGWHDLGPDGPPKQLAFSCGKGTKYAVEATVDSVKQPWHDPTAEADRYALDGVEHEVVEGVLGEGEWEVAQPVVIVAVLRASCIDQKDLKHSEGMEHLDQELQRNGRPVVQPYALNYHCLARTLKASVSILTLVCHGESDYLILEARRSSRSVYLPAAHLRALLESAVQACGGAPVASVAILFACSSQWAGELFHVVGRVPTVVCVKSGATVRSLVIYRLLATLLSELLSGASVDEALNAGLGEVRRRSRGEKAFNQAKEAVHVLGDGTRRVCSIPLGAVPSASSTMFLNGFARHRLGT